jgi:excisionase family DNA binding protein
MGTERNEHRLTYAEAARVLGISTDAARMRVRRGTLRSERDGDGTVRVLLDADQLRPDNDVTNNDLVSVLREQLAEEREARRRADTIILNLTQANATLASRVPALQAANDERPDVPASRDDPSGGYSNTGSPREDREKPASWWTRLFR